MKKILLLLLMLTMIPLSLLSCGEKEVDDGKYNIKFISVGVEIASVETDGKSLVELPADPVRPGYTFDGWYWDNNVWSREFTADYFINTPFTSSIDVKVYAKFTYTGSDTGIPGVGEDGIYYDPEGWTDPEK